MTDDPKPELLPVEQRHRDAAAWSAYQAGFIAEGDAIRDGGRDDRRRVQSYARFERDCLTRAASPSAASDVREAAGRMGAWMSAAMDDPQVCEAMKADIRAWFDAGEPIPTRCPDVEAVVEPEEKGGYHDVPRTDPALIEHAARALCDSRGEAYDGSQVRFIDGEMHSVTFLEIAKHDARAVLQAIPQGEGWQPIEGADALAEFEIWQASITDPDDEMMVAGSSGPRPFALREAMHYADVYGQDGPVRVEEIIRRSVPLPTAPTKGGGDE